MRLETDLVTIDDVDQAALRQALDALDGDANARAILSSSEETYLQAAFFENGFVIEKREGSEENHFHAVPSHAPLPALREKPKRNWFERLVAAPDFPTSECAYTKDQMIEVFAAYLDGREGELIIDWSPGYCDH